MLKVNPTNPAGVVTRSYIFLTAKNYDEAAAVLKRAIELTGKNPDKPAAVFFLMLAAVENEMPPAATKTRARAVLEHGLAVQPESIELVQAEYLLLASTGDPKGAMALIESKTKNDPKGTFRRLLVDVLRDRQEYDRAEQVLRELIEGRRTMRTSPPRWCRSSRCRPPRQPSRARPSASDRSTRRPWS